MKRAPSGQMKKVCGSHRLQWERNTRGVDCAWAQELGLPVPVK